jgi:hypothetical protein
MFRVQVDSRNPPAVVRGTPSGSAQPMEVYLQWDRTLDDERHLRRCPVCECPDLFVRKDFPQVTAFSLVIAAGIASMILLGIGEFGAAIVVLAAVVLLDLAILLFARRRLECYRCGSVFRDTPISAQHQRWNQAIQNRHRDTASADTPAAPPTATTGALPLAPEERKP